MDEQQSKQAEIAKHHFKVTDWGHSRETVWINAEAKTGSRYAVMVSILPEKAARREGGHQLITVLQPWQASYVVGMTPELNPDYIWEKLLPRDRQVDRMHGGDLISLVLTVNEALKVHAELLHPQRRVYGTTF